MNKCTSIKYGAPVKAVTVNMFLFSDYIGKINKMLYHITVHIREGLYNRGKVLQINKNVHRNFEGFINKIHCVGKPGWGYFHLTEQIGEKRDL